MRRYVTAAKDAGKWYVFWYGQDVTNRCISALSCFGFGFVNVHHTPNGKAYCDFDPLSKLYGEVPAYRRWGRVHLVERSER